MIPFDGTGFGRSLYWEMRTKEIARKNNEYCPCWDLRNPVIEFSSDGHYNVLVGCSMPMDTCIQNFDQTNAKMTKLFKKFYKDG